MKIEIKHRLNGNIIFTGEFGSLKIAVVAAISSGANLSWANLFEADLSEANLSEANLSWANLSRANLFRANLFEADLFRADLSGANLFGADQVISLGFPGGWPAHAWLRQKQLSIRVGCREFRYKEALNYWQGKPDRLEQLAATEYARQIALARKWEV
jgi:hypothetical protein